MKQHFEKHPSLQDGHGNGIFYFLEEDQNGALVACQKILKDDIPLLAQSHEFICCRYAIPRLRKTGTFDRYL